MRVGILGVGIAGRARVRAVRERPELTLFGAYRGRFAEELGVPLLDDADAVIRGCDLLIVASPSTTHAAYVRAGLDAGCHVICEYPLAESAEIAAALFDLADSVGRVLHVEHLGVLSPTTRAAASYVVNHGLRGGALHFTSGGAPWHAPRPHALQQLERIHRWVAAAGTLDATRVYHLDGARLDLGLRFGDVEVTLHAERGNSLSRTQRWVLQTRDGVFEAVGSEATWRGEPVQTPWKGLFALDLDLALASIRRGDPSYVPRERELEVLRWVDAVATAPLGAWIDTPVGAGPARPPS